MSRPSRYESGDDFAMTVTEIAEALEMSVPAVKDALFRATKKIRSNHPEMTQWIEELIDVGRNN